MGFPMNPALPPALARSLSLIALLLLGVSCNPVDPDEGLVGLTTRCVHQDSCAPGFECEAGRGVCVRRAGELCREGFENQRCERTEGVCGQARRACVNGVVADSCAPELYGPDYEAVETRCDGLDNDCDGSVDLGVNPLGLAELDTRPGSGVSMRLVPFGSGLLAITVNTVTSVTSTQSSLESLIRVQALDLSRHALPGTTALLLERVPGSLMDLRVLPFSGGAFVQWQSEKVVTPPSGQSYTTYVTRVARVDVDASGRASVGLAARDMPPFPGARLRAAVSGDAQQVLIVWAAGGVQGQLYSLALEPLSGQTQLSAAHPEDPVGGYVASFDVAAHGSSDFLTAWAIQPPYDPSNPVPTSPNRLRFLQYSSTLAPKGAVVGLIGEVGYLSDLRVLGASRADLPPLAAWINIPPWVSGPQQPNTLRYAQPFSPGLPLSEPQPVQANLQTVAMSRDSEDQVLIALLQQRPRGNTRPVVRRVNAAFAAEERVIDVELGWSYRGISFVPGADPEQWGVSFVSWSQVWDGKSWQETNEPRVASMCRF
jgi:hypothetical protein